MGSRQMFSVILFALAVYHTRGCQGPWDLRIDSEPLNDNKMVRYKNFTTIGRKEWLSFSWEGNEEIWNLDLLFFLKRADKMEGKIRYRKTSNEEVMIPWEIENKEIFSMINSKKIFSKPWTFSLCNRLDISFSSDEEGNWAIRIGEYLLHRTSVDETVHREKRSDDIYGMTNTTSYQPPRGLGFMDDIYDYLFGEEDPATGRRAGIFIRMKSWMRDMACRLGIACEGANPPSFPLPTVPPPEPDAETITEDNYRNEVFQK